MADGDEMFEEVDFNYLETVKVILGISDDSLDKVLLVYISMAKQSILNYCNISELPSALDFVLCQLVVDTYYDIKSKTVTGQVVGNVSSISEDGRTVSFTNGSEFKSIVDDRITRIKELNRYKKLFRI